MRSHLLRVLAGALGFGLLLAGQLPGQDEPPPPPAEENNVEAPPGVEVQARGPVHEAYAEPSEAQPQAVPVLPKEPPAPVDEAPPAERPEGEGVVWVPGYWAWDDDRGDFLWVSGFWRTAPPGKQWVPGNWQQVEDGWQWTGGFWADLTSQEVEYLSPPPAPIEDGPSVPAPDATSTYVPGCWVWRETRYLWRPGYWVAYRPDWVWCPPRYVSTPAGCVFVAGYWDRPLHLRGLLFAPVAFDQRVLRPGFVYRPAFAVQPDFLLGAMFVRTTNRRYYFGDYFEARYTRAYVPWVDYRVNRVSYDVNYSYYRHAFAGQAGWDRGLRALYTERYTGTVARPPRTWAQQRVVVNNIVNKRITNVTVNKTINITNVQNVTVLAPVTKVKNIQVTALSSLAGLRPGAAGAPPVHRELRLQQVPKAQLAQVQQAVTHYRAVQREREQGQAKLTVKGPAPKVGVAHAPAAPRTVRMAALKAPPPHVVGAAPRPPAPPVHPLHHDVPKAQPREVFPKKGPEAPLPKGRPVVPVSPPVVPKHLLPKGKEVPHPVVPPKVTPVVPKELPRGKEPPRPVPPPKAPPVGPKGAPPATLPPTRPVPPHEVVPHPKGLTPTPPAPAPRPPAPPARPAVAPHAPPPAQHQPPPTVHPRAPAVAPPQAPPPAPHHPPAQGQPRPVVPPHPPAPVPPPKAPPKG